MHTSQIAGLSRLPDGNEGALVEIDRIDLRVHMLDETAVLTPSAVTKVASC